MAIVCGGEYVVRIEFLNGDVWRFERVCKISKFEMCEERTECGRRGLIYKECECACGVEMSNQLFENCEVFIPLIRAMAPKDWILSQNNTATFGYLQLWSNDLRVFRTAPILKHARSAYSSS